MCPKGFFNYFLCVVVTFCFTSLSGPHAETVHGCRRLLFGGNWKQIPQEGRQSGSTGHQPTWVLVGQTSITWLRDWICTSHLSRERRRRVRKSQLSLSCRTHNNFLNILAATKFIRLEHSSQNVRAYYSNFSTHFLAPSVFYYLYLKKRDNVIDLIMKITGKIIFKTTFRCPRDTIIRPKYNIQQITRILMFFSSSIVPRG